MLERNRNKLRASELIDLIIQVPDLLPKDNQYDELASEVEGLIATKQIAESRSCNNAAMIINLEAKNKIMNDQNNEMRVEIDQLKTQYNSCSNHLDGIEQYLRRNNIEIVGLPPPVEDQNEE